MNKKSARKLKDEEAQEKLETFHNKVFGRIINVDLGEGFACMHLA